MADSILKQHAEIYQFIEDFRSNVGKNEDAIIYQFTNGYCYHFAHMLKQLFHEGEVCWVAPYSHFVYVFDGVPYDIRGVYDSDYDYFIPEVYLGDLITDFQHIEGRDACATVEQIDNVVDRYLAATNDQTC